MKKVTWGLVAGFVMVFLVAAMTLGCSVTKMEGKSGDIEAQLKTFRSKGEANMTITKDAIWLETKESQ